MTQQEHIFFCNSLFSKVTYLSTNGWRKWIEATTTNFNGDVHQTQTRKKVELRAIWNSKSGELVGFGSRSIFGLCIILLSSNGKIQDPVILRMYVIRQVIQLCVKTKNLALGSKIHGRIVTRGLQIDSFLSTQLITLYSLCGCITSAVSVFKSVGFTNLYLFNAMIRGYVVNGFYQQAVSVFYDGWRWYDVELDSHSFSCVLKACGLLPGGRWGREVHGLAFQFGLNGDLFVGNSLISMYANCGRLEEGVQVFDGMTSRDVVSWNSVITAYAQNGFCLDVVLAVKEMMRSGLRPDAITIITVLAVSFDQETVREVHCYVLRNGLEHATNVRNVLISAYGRYGMIREMRWLFDNWGQVDRVSWNALISCHAQLGYFKESMKLLREMKVSGSDADLITYSGIISSLVQDDRSNEAFGLFRELLSTGMKLDAIMIASVLPAISGVQFLLICKELHAYSYRHWLISDRRVRNALVSVYSKCGEVMSSSRVFKEINHRDVISWSSVVAGYAQNGYYSEAIENFREMIRADIKPNPITMTSILSACAGISLLKQGKEIHSWAIKSKLEDQTFVGSALLDMYAKCGAIEISRKVYDLINEKNVITWNIMIGGYALHGLAEEALEIFQSMKEKDDVSFIAALSACSHGGLVQEGIEIFNSMDDFKIKPRQKHYACMIDMLARSGRLDQAFELVKSMPMEVTDGIWGSLLGASKVHSNLKIGMYTTEKIIGHESKNPGHYVLMSNLLAGFGRWSDVEVMREVMREKGIKKVAGCSWIELDSVMHCFVARNTRDLPELDSMESVLSRLDEQVKMMTC